MAPKCTSSSILYSTGHTSTTAKEDNCTKSYTVTRPENPTTCNAHKGYSQKQIFTEPKGSMLLLHVQNKQRNILIELRIKNFLVVATNEFPIIELHNKLKTKYTIKGLGPPKVYLG